VSADVAADCVVTWLSPVSAEEALVAVVTVVAAGCGSVFGLLSPAG